MTMKRKRSMFGEPTSKTLAKIVEIDDPASARKSAAELKERFNSLESRDAKVATKRATVLASSRAKAMLKKKNLSVKEREEFKDIAKIYKNAYKTMRID